MKTLPAGLVDNNIEFFTDKDQVFVLQNGIVTEYHECPLRNTCKCSGHVCLMPAKLSHKEIETVKAIATGEPSKQAADRLGVTFNTIRAYLKSVHKKTNAHSRADVMNFAYRHNII